MSEPAINKAITILDMLSREPETVRLAELRMKHILDEKSMIEGAKEERRSEGKSEVAAIMIKKGMNVELISEVTGLSMEQVLEIQKQIVS